MAASTVANDQTVIETGPRLGDLSLLTEAERQRIVVEWNQTQSQYSSLCIHEMFEEQVRRVPGAMAIAGDEGYLTFDQLNRKANQLAHYLRRLGAGPEGLVGISMGRSFDMLVALWGILKAGATYVPVEPTLPAERLKFMLQDSQISILLTQERFLANIPENSGRVISVDRNHEISCEDDQNPRPQANPDNLAYVIYTSGSTGRPKGVAVTHRNIVNFFCGMDDRIACGPGDRLLAVTSISFDISVLELLWTLTRGAKVILVTEPLDISGRSAVPVTNLSLNSLAVPKKSLSELADEHQPTLMQCTPSMIGVLASGGVLSSLHSLHTLMLGGEPLLPGAVRELRNVLSCTLVNMYGPTETTIWSSTGQVEQIPDAISIGTPIANTVFYILDRAHNQPLPVGVIGELFIGGEGVTRGYRHRPELTAERFVPDPFTRCYGSRLYKTGDLARYLPGGKVELLGRSDHQVKIRGYRVELGEIEAVLLDHPDIQQTVVTAEEGASGEKWLVAYIVSKGRAEPNLKFDHLNRFLKSRLPSYMIPAAFVSIKEIPLNQSGKVDRRRLPAPQFGQGTTEYVLPQSRTQETLCRIWSTVLSVEQVGAHDNFFALGGHSLLATRVLTRVRDAFSVDLQLRTVLEFPTLAELAARIDDQINAGPKTRIFPVKKIRHNATIPLSYAQQRLWLMSQIDGASEAYHISMTFALRGGLDEAILRRTLDRIVVRHEILRTTFLLVNDEPVQRIFPAEDSQFYLRKDDISQHSQPQAELERLLALEASLPFNFEQGPLVRARLIRQAENEHALQITMHHIVADGWSLAVLINELNSLYSSFMNGKEDPLPALEVQYADYAVWQREWIEGDVLRTQADYWATALSGIPELLGVPADHARPVQQSYAGELAAIELDKSVTTRLRELSARQGTTLYMTLLGAWAAVLGRLSNQHDVVIGTAVANRDRVEIEPLIGFFVNTLALRFDLSESPSVSELLQRVKKQTLAAHQHRDIPFEYVIELLRPARSLAYSPLFQAMFIWQNMPSTSLNLPGLKLEWMRTTSPVMAKFDLTLWLQESNGKILGGLEYATALFERSTIERYLCYFCTFLEGLLAGDAEKVDLLPLLTQTERHEVVYGWNRTSVQYPDTFIHKLFEGQVLQRPEATAVVYEDKRLTYVELNRQANRLAHHLRSLGVVPDARIAICMDRSLEMIVVLLAVLKAGGTYVPLDPGYPIERLRYMLEDSSPVLLLTEKHLQKLFTGCSSDLVALDVHSLLSAFCEQPESNLDPADLGLTPDHLAYVIYTSGSTGLPKGVQLPLRGLTNFLLSMRDCPGLTAADTFVAAATISFDIAGYELWLPLMVGGRIVLVDRATAADGAALMDRLRSSGATVLQATPTTWRLLLAAGWQGTPGLKMLCGAEALSGDLAEELLSRGAELWNLYGPTETTVWSTVYRVPQKSIKSGTVFIGRPIANMHVYILDTLGQPTPVGVVGELYIAGVGLSRGYANRPQLTAERFLPNPFVEEPGGLMYRTGDLGRRLADGNIEFLDRNDFQVKVRGFRIELREIEACLLSHPAVTEAAVILREDATGDKRLVAYYTGVSTGEEVPFGVSPEQLRKHLLTHLPEYMVPAAYVRLEQMPVTPTGKLDRKALPIPVEQAHAVSDHETPMGDMEIALARIWADVLKFERIGRRDNFFDLGGHSLLAVQVMTRLHQSLGVQVSMKDLFAHPVLSDLACKLEKVARGQLPTIEPVKRGKRLPLSYAQQRLLFMDQMNPGSFFYNLNGAVGLQGKLDVEALDRALQLLVKRHEALRTRFEVVGGEAVQVVEEEGKIDLQQEDLSGIGERGEREEELQRRLREEAQKPYDLVTGPLVRGLLVKLGKEEHGLLLGMHHIVSDGWSMGVLVRELTVMYEGVRQGREVGLRPLGIQYGDYAVWQREWLKGEVLEKQLEYWRKQLAGAPRVLELPTDHPRPRVQKFRGARHEKVLRAGLREELMSLCGGQNATLFMGTLAAFKLVLGYCTSKNDIVVGTHLANRPHLETEDLIGFFVNQLALRTDLSGNPTFVELLARVRNTTLDAFTHQDVPFDLLVAELRPERSTSYSPIYQVLFSFPEASSRFVKIPELDIYPIEVPLEAARFDLVVTVGKKDRDFMVFVEYDTELFGMQSISRLVQLYEIVLDYVIAHPMGTKESIMTLLAKYDRQYRKDRNTELSKLSSDKLQRLGRRGAPSV